MTANADYGVSIVESFAPPAQWLPNSTVNKDVYATNTGNIAAFVKETVSGVLTITNEKPVSGTYNSAEEYVELTEEERYVVEAGAYLAYKPAGDTVNSVGNQIVVRPDDNTGTNKVFDFVPNTQGLYVFRRSIDVNNDITSTNGDATHDSKDYGAETFTYDAYYFVPGATDTADKFLKVGELIVTEDTVPDIAGDGINTDGLVTSAEYKLYQEVKEVVKNVGLTYKNFDAPDADSGVTAGQYLVASYDTGINLNADYINAAKSLDDARHEYELALEAQAKAATESSTANTDLNTKKDDLAAKKTALIEAMNTLAEKAQEMATATAAYNNLVTEYNNLSTRKGQLEADMYGAVGNTTSNATPASVYGRSQVSLTVYSASHTELDNEVLAALSKPLADCTYADLSTFTPSTELHEYYEKYVDKKLAEEQYTALSTEYSSVQTRMSDIGTDSTGLRGAAKTSMDSAVANYGNASSGAVKAYNDALDGYNSAYNDFRNAVTASNGKTESLDTANARLGTARTKWMAALSDFNTNYDAVGKHYAYDASVLKIYIKLADVILNNDGLSNAKWQMMPAPIANAQEAVFYYTGLLDSAETSSKLIDSVHLDKRTTQEMYKNFDFDINVALDSVQVTQDDNGRYTSEAANDHFTAANVAVKTPTSVDTPLVWTATP